MANVLPNSLDAEKAVLGAALLSEDSLQEAISILEPRDFYNLANREIFEALLELHRLSKQADILTVTEELNKRGTLKKAGDKVYIATLAEDVPSITNATGYIEIVSNYGTLRKLIETGSNIVDMAMENKDKSSDILEMAEREIFALRKSRKTKSVVPISEVVCENLRIISEKNRQKGEPTGVASGLLDLDKKLSGFQPSDMIVLAARPSMGKTAFALNVALNAALKEEKSVLIFSLEMSKEQLGQRFLAMESHIDSHKMNTGELDNNDWENLGIGVDRLSKTSIYIDDTAGIKLSEIKNKCRKLKAEHGLDLIILDYLQLMDSESSRDNRQMEITAISRGLKLLAREIDCPIIVLSQLSRAPEQRQDHRPILSDLRESGAIEQDADVVLFLYRDEVYNKDNEDTAGLCEINVSKHRNGPTGVVIARWQSQYTRFVNHKYGG